jgi:HSP20 family protein
MRLIRYQTSPFFTPSNYPTLRDEMDRLFDAALPALGALQRGGLFGDLRHPFPVDLYQEKTAVTVRAELPGFRPEDIAVEVENDVLTVTAQQKTEAKAVNKTDDKTPDATTPERRFTRKIALPDNLDLEKIHAAHENGVLTVTLPKREAVKPKQIAVEVK